MPSLPSSWHPIKAGGYIYTICNVKRPHDCHSAAIFTLFWIIIVVASLLLAVVNSKSENDIS